MEYAPQEHLRVNVVAPGVVDTPLHKNNPMEFLHAVTPWTGCGGQGHRRGRKSYLTEASQVTGEVLHVDGGAHLGRW